MNDDRTIRRISAALRQAERSQQSDAVVHLTLKLIRACKKADNFASTRMLATRHAHCLIQTAPRHNAVRRFWQLAALGRDLVPLTIAQLQMFSGDCYMRPRESRPGEPHAPGEATTPSYVGLMLVVDHLSYVADLRSLACVCKTSREAVHHAAVARVHRSTPLCWFDVVASYRYGLKVRLPGGGTLCAKQVKHEAATGACFLDEHTDVFECMLRAYASGRTQSEILFGENDARDVRNARDDISLWLCCFGCSLAERDFGKCVCLLRVCANRRLYAEGIVAIKLWSLLH